MGKADHRATSRVLDILELLSSSHEGNTLTEIANKLEVPKSSLLPILHTMSDRNFLQYTNNDTSRYAIGRQAYIVGSTFGSNRSAKSFIRDRMKRMVDVFNETSQMGMLSGNNVFYALRVEAQNPIMLRSQVEKLLPAYCTGLGKALLSHFTHEQIENLYPKGLTAYTKQTIPSIDALMDELKMVRETGFAYEHSELVEGVECVAVPLCHEDCVLASVSFSMPAYRAEKDRIEQARELLSKFRAEIEDYFVKFSIDKSATLL